MQTEILRKYDHRNAADIDREFFRDSPPADRLAYFALNSQNALQTNSGSWLWILLLSYSLRIYFDFSGYTDIAIGSAVLMGIKLPEF